MNWGVKKDGKDGNIKNEKNEKKEAKGKKEVNRRNISSGKNIKIKGDDEKEYDYNNAKMVSVFQNESRAITPQSDNLNIHSRNNTDFFITNFKDTINTVKNEAAKVKLIEKNFDNKKETMETFFKRYELPKISEYERLMLTDRHENNKIQDDKKTKLFKTKTEMQLRWKDLRPNLEEQYKTKIEDEVERKARLLEQKEKKEMQEHKEINNYLKYIREMYRSPQYFVDCYSLRDGKTNKSLTKFNKKIFEGGSTYYGKKNLNNKLNTFVQNEKKKVEKIQKKKQDDIKNKKFPTVKEMVRDHERELTIALHNKMIENFKRTPVNSDTPIKIDAYLQMEDLKIKNKIKFDPYEDYLEGFNSFKEKVENEKEIQKMKEVKKIISNSAKNKMGVMLNCQSAGNMLGGLLHVNQISGSARSGNNKLNLFDKFAGSTRNDGLSTKE